MKKMPDIHSKMLNPIDEGEAQLISEADQYVRVDEEESERLKVKFKEAAKNTLKKTERTNIRISEADLEGIKLIAAREGVGYQTFISSVLHKVASGQLLV